MVVVFFIIGFRRFIWFGGTPMFVPTVHEKMHANECGANNDQHPISL